MVYVQIMASKSLTAVTSFVSVAAEKTVVALRCNTRGFEKVTYPVLGIIAMASALALFAVAAGTPVWVQVSMQDLECTNKCWIDGCFAFL